MSNENQNIITDYTVMVIRVNSISNEIRSAGARSGKVVHTLRDERYSKPPVYSFIPALTASEPRYD